MKRQVIIVLILIVALGYAGFVSWPRVAAYVPGFAKEAPKAEKDLPAAPTTTIAEGINAAGIKEMKKGEGVEAAPAIIKLVDPFIIRTSVKSLSEPMTEPEDGKEVKKETELVLEGIWVDSGMRVAFISEQAVIEGGTVMGWRVRRITKTQVVLVKGRENKTLKLEGIQ
ncbi:MAG: hypothetical protein ABIA67_00785 [Candidatus Margulisiibacteriota bacterium]